jgi:three-Cys-motif partner protein
MVPLLALGLFTRPVVFVLSGMMAVAAGDSGRASPAAWAPEERTADGGPVAAPCPLTLGPGRRALFQERLVSAQPKFDEIGYWSEVKLDIIRSYASAYSKILSGQPGLFHVHIDGFAGAGQHFRRGTLQTVPGSPLRALDVVPPFREYYFVDLDGDKAEHLRRLAGTRSNVHVLQGDCNTVLTEHVFPKVRWSDFRRGLCLLDPYGLHLDWRVIATAGQMKSIDLFLNFPIADANRNALWRDREGVHPEQAERMTRYWGDQSWRQIAYRPRARRGLFEDGVEKVGNEDIVRAFSERLRQVAGFSNVPDPLPMKNSQGAVVYYLYFASQKDVANKIVRDIFRTHASRGD